MCPDGLFVEIDDLQDRAASVMALGDAKAIRCGPCQGVFLRSTKPNVCVSSIDGALNVPVDKMTAIAGGAAILLENDKFWTCEGLVATVENEEAFWRHHLVLPEVDLAVYTQGKMSDRLVAWLSSPPMKGCLYVHWGDYDPMGVIEYCRLAAACPGRVRFHIPDNLDILLPRYGKTELITKQTDLLANLYDRLDDEVVRRMVHLFENHRRGLEQEALLNRP